MANIKPKPSNYVFGRPTLYKDEFCQKVIEMATRGEPLISFCAEITIAERTRENWCKKHPEFNEACAIALAKLIDYKYQESANIGKDQCAAWIFMTANMTKLRRTDETNTTKIIGDPEQPLVTAIKDLSDDELVAKMRERGIAFEA